VRIEIADAATLGISGLSGQVANIIVRADTVSGQFSYSPEFRTNFTDPVLTRFSVSVSGKRGPVEYTLGLENQAGGGGAGGPTLIFNGDGPCARAAGTSSPWSPISPAGARASSSTARQLDRQPQHDLPRILGGFP
jgi:hypothetical protein